MFNNSLIKISSKHFNSFDEVIITGSYTENSLNEKSDIDFLVLSKEVNYVIVENHIYDNISYQFIIFPYYKPEWFIHFQQEGKYIYSSMITKGKTIKSSPISFFETMKNEFHSEFLIPNSKQMLYLRNRICELIKDFDNKNTYEENQFLSIDLFRHITKLITHAYDYNGKHLAKELLKVPEMSKLLTEKYRKSIITNNFEEFINLCSEILESIGGPVSEYSTNFACQFQNYTSGLFIQFANLNYNNVHTSSILSDIASVMPQRTIYNIFYEGKNQTLERGTYVFIWNENGYEEIISILNRYFKDRIEFFISKNISISFPYQVGFDTFLLYGGKEIFFKFSKDLNALSLCILEDHRTEKNNRQFVLSVAYRILLVFYIKHHNTSDIVSIYKGMKESLQCEAINPNNNYNMSQVHVVKEAIENIHNSTYLKQKKSLMNLSDYVINSLKEDVTDKYILLALNMCNTLINIDTTQVRYPSFLLLGSNNLDRLCKTIFNQILSILHFEPHEKYSIFHSLLRLIEDI